MRSSTWPSGIFGVLAAVSALAQPVRVYSEFVRVGPGGGILPEDQVAKPREILSPAVARQAYASFRVVVEIPPRQNVSLHVGQNPENAVTVTLYREAGDRLEPVRLPFEASGGAQASTVSFWMDLWVPRHASPRRIKVEPQFSIGEHWVIYPMEVRITAATVPPVSARPAALPPASERADASALGPLRAWACGTPEPPAQADPPLTSRRLVRRNAMQDVALARELEVKLGRDRVLAGLLSASGYAAVEAFCGAGYNFASGEWYLRWRDFLYRTAQE